MKKAQIIVISISVILSWICMYNIGKLSKNKDTK